MKNSEIAKITSGKVEGKLSTDQVTAWLAQIDERKKAEKDWRSEAGKINKLYEGYKRDHSPFNILYSNTETLAPALYSNTPRPAVGRRYKDKDPLGLAVSNTLNRTLNFCMDSNDMDEADFDTQVDHVILQALVPGRGAVKYKYAADVVEDEEAKKLSSLKPKDVPNTPAEGDEAQEEVPMKVVNERICGELIGWDRLIIGYAQKWHEVPWVAVELHMVESEVEKNFPGFGRKVKYAELECHEGDEKSSDKRKVAVIYELWDRTTKTVVFLCQGYKDAELKMVDDPLGLSGFFPMPKPLMFLDKVSDLIPQPIYNLYREQAEELNLITRRITAVTAALKVRGVYPQELTELADVLKADDNTLVAIENTQMFEGRDLKTLLMLMPLSELVSVLQQLYVQRTNIKQVIYEITGISDILRGSSVASETATAQNIKNQWGTLRLKKMQKRVTKWCRDSLRIQAEIAAKKFSMKTLVQMTELPYLTPEQYQQAEMGMQQWQQQQVLAQQQPPQPGQPPAQPAQPPQQLVDALATPQWSQILDVLRNKLMMEYRIDIETNSTIADDLAEDQKNIGELLNSLSQFLNGVAPLIENGSMPFEVAKAMMLGMIRKMAMGPEVEEALEKMQPPKPPEPEAPPQTPPDPNIQLKAQAEKQALEGSMKMQQMQMAQAEQEHQQKMQIMQTELEIKQEEFAIKREELRQKSQANQAKFEQQMALAKNKASQPTQPTGGA